MCFTNYYHVESVLQVYTPSIGYDFVLMNQLSRKKLTTTNKTYGQAVPALPKIDFKKECIFSQVSDGNILHI